FGTVAPIGVLANLVAIPLAGIVVPGLVLALALSGVIAGAAHLVAAGAGLGLALLDLAAGTAAVVPGGHVVMVAGWEAAAVWAGVALVAWWLWHSPRRPWLIAARVAFATTVFVATTLRDVFPLDACRCLTVFFLDVGQGDAALLRTPHGRWVVIDAGPARPRATRDAGWWSRSCGAKGPAGWRWRWRRTATPITWAGCPRWWKRSIPSWCSSRGSRWGGRCISSFSPG